MRPLACTLAAVTAAVLVGCGSDPEPVEPTTPAELANPASVFCIEQGGSLEIVDETDGQVGYCNLPDGTRIEEWEYFRSQHPTATNQP
jgi:putative hemolysin